MDIGNKTRLTPFGAHRFDANTLFGKVARALCEANCLPRKELFEAWEVAKRTQRRLHRHGVTPKRIVDLACGHGVTGAVLALFEPTFGPVVGVDRVLPPSAEKCLTALQVAFPQLRGRVTLRQAELQALPLDEDDVVMCVHGCGVLTDVVIDRSIAAGAFVSVLPCCHRRTHADTGGLEGWVDFALAMDLRRAERLRAAGYQVFTQTIPEAITPKNRLLLASRPKGH